MSWSEFWSFITPETACLPPGRPLPLRGPHLVAVGVLAFDMLLRIVCATAIRNEPRNQSYALLP